MAQLDPIIKALKISDDITNLNVIKSYQDLIQLDANLSFLGRTQDCSRSQHEHVNRETNKQRI